MDSLAACPLATAEPHQSVSLCCCQPPFCCRLLQDNEGFKHNSDARLPYQLSTRLCPDTLRHRYDLPKSALVSALPTGQQCFMKSGGRPFQRLMKWCRLSCLWEFSGKKSCVRKACGRDKGPMQMQQEHSCYATRFAIHYLLRIE